MSLRRATFSPMSLPGLIHTNYHMDDFQKSARQHPERKLVIYINQGDGAPVTRVQSISTLEDKRNNPKSLGQVREPEA